MESRHVEIESRECCVVASIFGLWQREGVADKTCIDYWRPPTTPHHPMSVRVSSLICSCNLEETGDVVERGECASRDWCGAGVGGGSAGVVLNAMTESDVQEMGGVEGQGKRGGRWLVVLVWLCSRVAMWSCYVDRRGLTSWQCDIDETVCRDVDVVASSCAECEVIFGSIG